MPQAHGAILLGHAERGRARLPARDDAAGRRVPHERHLPHRGQHRSPARSLQHRAGVPRRRGRRLHPGLRPPRRYRRARAGLDAGHRDHRVRGRPRGAADQALRRGRAQRRGVHHHQAQHPRARHAGGRSRQRGAGLRDGRAPDGRAVRALRPRHGRSLLPGHPRQVPRHLSQRAAAEDRRRRIFLGRLRRARRRHRSQAAQDRAQDDQAGRAHHARLHRHRSAIDRSDQLAGGLCRRRLSHQVDRADFAQPRRHAGARRGDSRQRRRLRGVRRGVPAEGHLDHAGMAGGDQCALVRAAALPRAARGRGGAGGRRPHAGGPGDDPLHGILRPRSRRQAFSVARSSRRRLRRSQLRRRQRRHSHRAGFAQPAGRVHGDALSAHRGEARAAHGFRRRRQAPRRARLREALSRAGRLPHHRDSRPGAARLLRRQRRQGRGSRSASPSTPTARRATSADSSMGSPYWRDRSCAW